MSDNTTTQPNEITEAVMQTIISLQADPDDVVCALTNVLVWHLRRMPFKEAKTSLRHVFNALAANGYTVSRRPTWGTADARRAPARRPDRWPEIPLLSHAAR